MEKEKAYKIVQVWQLSHKTSFKIVDAAVIFHINTGITCRAGYHVYPTSDFSVLAQVTISKISSSTTIHIPEVGILLD